MERENYGGGDNLPPQIKQIKDQIEADRLVHINKTFEERYKPTVANQALSSQTLAINLNRQNESGENNETDNNCLLARIKKPHHVFKPFTYDDSNQEEIECVPHPEVKLPTVKLPYVEQLPRSKTWVLTSSNQLMNENDSVIGKRQFYYEDGELAELSSEEYDDEEPLKDKIEFSECADKLIWKVGQDCGLDNPVVQSAVSKSLESHNSINVITKSLDVLDLMEERYDELKLKNNGNAGEASGSKSNCIITNFRDAIDRRFCRLCSIFDCQMHEKFQPKIKPRENNPILFEKEEDRQPCNEHCFLKVRSITEGDQVVDNEKSMSNNKGKNVLVSNTNEWTPVEKELYFDGVQIFGRNSCLIAKNVLWKLKTCSEVYNYMQEDPSTDQTTEVDTQVNKKTTTRGQYKKVKGKQYGRIPPALKKKANGEEVKLDKHYTPCTCYPTCGDDCTCLLANGKKSCCEKYCGCLKNCKNRFKGCSCKKGQCLDKHCPCVAASRECDPDVCQNCWISCEDGSHDGETQTQTSDNMCKNIQFLLKQHKKILIGKSDVQGWGAFTRHTLKDKDFIGEYTGELITHEEADARGIVEEKIGSSYLFTLNDKYVIDGRHKGNKLRFLNHSADPNCYAQIRIVRGDHRIGIYAGRDIQEGEELFFDYNYKPDVAKWYPAPAEEKPKRGRPRGSGRGRVRTSTTT